MKETPKFNSTKISDDALKALRIISALTGEKQYEVLDRVLSEELKKVQSAG